MAVAYGVFCVVALAMIGVCYIVNKERDRYLFLLFVSVFVCNLGYFLGAMAKTLEFALFSNAVAYLGNIFLPFFVFQMIMKVCGFTCCKWISAGMLTVGGVFFLLIISSTYTGLYYKAVSIETVNGATRLVREYGPLHGGYYAYLLFYLVAMLGPVLYSVVKKKMTSVLQVPFLLTAVLGNVVIWFLEQLIPREFEFLSVAYLFTEVMILLLYGIVQQYGETGNRREPGKAETVRYAVAEPVAESVPGLFSEQEIQQIYMECVQRFGLTERETEVLRYILGNKRRKIIAEELAVSESTIKKHTAQIFKKMAVNNRIELFSKVNKL